MERRFKFERVAREGNPARAINPRELRYRDEGPARRVICGGVRHYAAADGEHTLCGALVGGGVFLPVRDCEYCAALFALETAPGGLDDVRQAVNDMLAEAKLSFFRKALRAAKRAVAKALDDAFHRFHGDA